MGRKVCFFDEEGGQTATCIVDKLDWSDFCCDVCHHNPFPGKVIPEDRVLRKFSFDPLV